ncbi:hypothetical protein FACS1894176_07220 [Bacteroidia bacterium]|nr:hypothetical protein FACS1894176_07220 [Bacteroidia bacterium]
MQDWNPELKAESLKTGDTVNYDEKGIKVLLGGGEEVKKDDEIKKEEKTSSKESVST